MVRNKPPAAKAASSAQRTPDQATPPIRRHSRLGAAMLEVFTSSPQRRRQP